MRRRGEGRSGGEEGGWSESGHPIELDIASRQDEKKGASLAMIHPQWGRHA